MKSYRQFCGIAKALDVIGQRWTMLILRELLLGPRRYSELQRSLEGITTNLLAKRMRELESSGLVERVRRDDGRAAWALTPEGEAVKPALLELGRFGARWMDRPNDDRTSHRWLMVSLQRRFSGSMAPTTGAIAFGDVWYTVEVDGESVATSDGEPSEADFVITGPIPAVAGLLAGTDRDAAGAGGREAGEVTISGDRTRARAFLRGLRPPGRSAPVPPARRD